MQRNQPTIYIGIKSMQKLQPFILPYMCKSMRYKLHNPGKHNQPLVDINLSSTFGWIYNLFSPVNAFFGAGWCNQCNFGK